jgi:hypothetical protein
VLENRALKKIFGPYGGLGGEDYGRFRKIA